MYNIFLKKLEQSDKPIDIIVVGLGFMGFGFFSATKHVPNLRVPLIITRRPDEAKKFLLEKGYKVAYEDNPVKIKELADEGYICVSDNLDLISNYPNNLVFEVTGTVSYGTDVALRAITAGKNLVTMNPELQATVGTVLKQLADKKGLIISDVLGDQPGSLARLIANAKMMGFKPLVAGNMKRYMDKHATQKQMQPWADDKGLAVRQTVSFTDGSKQSIEMTLVANYFGMNLLKPGMKGPQVDNIKQALDEFKNENIPNEGIVDYVIGRHLFPGVFVIAKHKDPNQQKYLRYLNMGEGPCYVLFDAYHLTHLEVVNTIASVILFGQETINNGTTPVAKSAAIAKSHLKKGQTLDGIGGDTVYGQIYHINESKNYLPVGLAEGAILLRDITQDEPISFDDVKLPINPATKILGLV